MELPNFEGENDEAWTFPEGGEEMPTPQEEEMEHKHENSEEHKLSGHESSAPDDDEECECHDDLRIRVWFWLINNINEKLFNIL